MTPEQARDLKSEVDAVSKRAVALTSGMDARALVKSPSGGGWSVAGNLQHLVLTADAMLPWAETALVELERGGRKATGPSGLGVIGWLLIKALEPPPRMKVKTPRPFEPASVGDPSSLVARLQETNSRLDTLITRATGLATSTVKVVSPFNANVKYNLYAAFRIILSHARRHLRQAEQVKAGRY